MWHGWFLFPLLPSNLLRSPIRNLIKDTVRPKMKFQPLCPSLLHQRKAQLSFLIHKALLLFALAQSQHSVPLNTNNKRLGACFQMFGKEKTPNTQRLHRICYNQSLQKPQHPTVFSKSILLVLWESLRRTMCTWEYLVTGLNRFKHLKHWPLAPLQRWFQKEQSFWWVNEKIFSCSSWREFF